MLIQSPTPRTAIPNLHPEEAQYVKCLSLSPPEQSGEERERVMTADSSLRQAGSDREGKMLDEKVNKQHGNLIWSRHMNSSARINAVGKEQRWLTDTAKSIQKYPMLLLERDPPEFLGPLLNATRTSELPSQLPSCLYLAWPVFEGMEEETQYFLYLICWFIGRNIVAL